MKVADFGLSEDVYTIGYFRQGKDDHIKLPIKWMAPESMTEGMFNEKTDVVRTHIMVCTYAAHIFMQWSFGVTCWEVFSVGKTPYLGINVASLPKLLEEGLRLDAPSNAANASEM